MDQFCRVCLVLLWNHVPTSTDASSSCFSYNPPCIPSFICQIRLTDLLKENKFRSSSRLVLGPSWEDEEEGRERLGHSVLKHCWVKPVKGEYFKGYHCVLVLTSCFSFQFRLTWNKKDVKYLNYSAVILPALESARPTLHFPSQFICSLSIRPRYSTSSQTTFIFIWFKSSMFSCFLLLVTHTYLSAYSQPCIHCLVSTCRPSHVEDLWNLLFLSFLTSPSISMVTWYKFLAPVPMPANPQRRCCWLSVTVRHLAQGRHGVSLAGGSQGHCGDYGTFEHK